MYIKVFVNYFHGLIITKIAQWVKVPRTRIPREFSQLNFIYPREWDSLHLYLYRTQQHN